MREPELVAISITCPDAATARAIADALVERRLVACAHVGPEVESLYRWQGRVQSAREQTLSVRTRAGLFDKVAETVRALHPYQVPAIVAHPIGATEDYRTWAGAETAGP